MTETISFKTFVHKRASYGYFGPERLDRLTDAVRVVATFSIGFQVLIQLLRGDALALPFQGCSLNINVILIPYAISLLFLTFFYGFRFLTLKTAYLTASLLLLVYALFERGLLKTAMCAYSESLAMKSGIWLLSLAFILSVAELWRNGPHDCIKKGLWKQVNSAGNPLSNDGK